MPDSEFMKDWVASWKAFTNPIWQPFFSSKIRVARRIDDLPLQYEERERIFGLYGRLVNIEYRLLLIGDLGTIMALVSGVMIGGCVPAMFHAFNKWWIWPPMAAVGLMVYYLVKILWEKILIASIVTDAKHDALQYIHQHLTGSFSLAQCLDQLEQVDPTLVRRTRDYAIEKPPGRFTPFVKWLNVLWALCWAILLCSAPGIGVGLGISFLRAVPHVSTADVLPSAIIGGVISLVTNIVLARWASNSVFVSVNAGILLALIVAMLSGMLAGLTPTGEWNVTRVREFGIGGFLVGMVLTLIVAILDESTNRKRHDKKT